MKINLFEFINLIVSCWGEEKWRSNSGVFVLLGLEGEGTDGGRKVFHNSGENVVLSFDKLRDRRGDIEILC